MKIEMDRCGGEGGRGSQEVSAVHASQRFPPPPRAQPGGTSLSPSASSQGGGQGSFYTPTLNPSLQHQTNCAPDYQS